MKKPLCFYLYFLITLMIAGCESGSKSPQIRIATNPWPGYELLFVADKMGYFKEEGLNIKLLQLSSLVDVQRTYNQGRADGMSSTVIEAIIVAALNSEKLNVVLVPDYSFGGDMLITNKNITSIKDLKGKEIGVETGSLGIVILEKALAKFQMELEDIKYVNLEQLKMKDMLETGEIIAAVTYPPFSTEMLRDDKYHAVFTTKEIPEEIIDVITVREDVLKQDPEWANKFHRAWIKALNYLENNRKNAVNLMAEREGISEDEFEEALADLYLVQPHEIKKVLQAELLKGNIESICNTLVRLKEIETDCKHIGELVRVVQ